MLARLAALRSLAGLSAPNRELRPSLQLATTRVKHRQWRTPRGDRLLVLQSASNAIALLPVRSPLRVRLLMRSKG